MTMKFYSIAISILITSSCARVNAQLQFKSTTNTGNNFTSFTPEKMYADMAKLKAITPPAYYSNPDFGKYVNDKTDWYEQIDKRTLKSRTYSINNSTVVMEYGRDNINYTDEQGWMRAVDTKLKPSLNGWAVTQQEIPTYLYTDGSTALSLGNGQLMSFNKNVVFNSSLLNTTQFTVGDNGMLIKNAAANTNKIIRFRRNLIETDYKIEQPLNLKTDLIIGEDVSLPPGYIISNDGAESGSLVVISPDGKIKAVFHVPVCYDNNRSRVTGSYQIHQQEGGYRLEIEVPSAWLNDASRSYPITIDPEVQGQTSTYSGNRIPSCLYPDYGSDSIQVIVPTFVTITNFYIQISFYAATIEENAGEARLKTDCDSSIWLTVPSSDTTVGGVLYIGLTDWLPYDDFSGCDSPSCSPEVINLSMELSRTAGPNTCDTTTLYYDPNNNGGYPFEAYVIGHTIETSEANWSLSPSPFCENSCNMMLNVTTNYGVPPYTISHPWASNNVTYGSYTYNSSTSEYISTGDTSIILTVPGCSDTATVTTKVFVPIPKITDACGDTVAGLLRKQVTLNPAPRPVFGYVASGNTVTFSDSSVGATSWKWEFGDESNSSKENPTHIYNSAGIYMVTLVVSNGTCTDSITKTINVNTGIAGVNGQNTAMHIYPNPAGNSTTVEFTSDEHSVQLTLVNVLGQTLYSETLKPSTADNYRTDLDLSLLPAGVYEVVITTASYSAAKEVIKEE